VSWIGTQSEKWWKHEYHDSSHVERISKVKEFYTNIASYMIKLSFHPFFPSFTSLVFSFSLPPTFIHPCSLAFLFPFVILCIFFTCSFLPLMLKSMINDITVDRRETLHMDGDVPWTRWNSNGKWLSYSSSAARFSSRQQIDTFSTKRVILWSHNLNHNTESLTTDEKAAVWCGRRRRLRNLANFVHYFNAMNSVHFCSIMFSSN
jgi:hypothetical protein